MNWYALSKIAQTPTLSKKFWIDPQGKTIPVPVAHDITAGQLAQQYGIQPTIPVEPDEDENARNYREFQEAGNAFKRFMDMGFIRLSVGAGGGGPVKNALKTIRTPNQQQILAVQSMFPNSLFASGGVMVECPGIPGQIARSQKELVNMLRCLKTS